MYLLSSFYLFVIGLSLFVVGLCFVNYGYIIFIDWEIFSLNSCSFTAVLLLDWISLIFISFVLIISSLVILYRFSYISEDSNNIRFLYLVLLFVLRILLIIVSPRLIRILLGWDGLGLVSYGLVIYFQNFKSYNAGMLTILINRIGDAALLMAVAWIFNFGGWHYLFYFNVWDFNIKIVLLIVILASFTKSAQIPFSSWLPAAIAAPTPVSALVHSSTLVTAGVYLLIRFRYLFNNLNCEFFVYIGTITMFVAGLGAIFEFDLKRVIALSTLSQLGFIIGVLFIGYPVLRFFHLLIHAFFKALLFLCAGLIIHIAGNNQDLRVIGGIYKCIPWTYTSFLISSISICGIPFISGFYSKDMILEVIRFNYDNFFIVLMYYLSVGLTVSYSVRLIYYTIGRESLYCCQSYFEDNSIIFSILFMVIISVLGGSFLSWVIFTVPEFYCLHLYTKLAPFLLILIGILISYKICSINWGSSFYLFHLFFGSILYMPYFRTFLLSSFGFYISKVWFTNVDCSWGEYIVSRSIFHFLIRVSVNVSGFYSNGIRIILISFILRSLFFFL